MPCLLLF